MHYGKSVTDLITLLKNEKYVYIQTHDFPDEDAVASAYALKFLFLRNGIDSRIVYAGEIQRGSLHRLIKELSIDIKHAWEYKIKSSDRIVIVDGCKGNQNVSDLKGRNTAIIDHHPAVVEEKVDFYDVRTEYGSCATIIFKYFEELNIEMTQKVASALLAGILVDTAHLTRRTSSEDVKAHAKIYTISDNLLVNTILRNNIQKKDLSFFKEALQIARIQNGFAYCYFKSGCSQNLLGIIADFLLTIEEVSFVFMCANNKGRINISLRSERIEWHCASIIHEVLEGIGVGGGHYDIAGGVIEDLNLFDENLIISRLKDTLKRRRIELQSQE